MFPLYTAVATVRTNASFIACRMRAVMVRASILVVPQFFLITSTRWINRWTNLYLRFAEILSLYFCALRGQRYGLKSQSRTEVRLHTLCPLLCYSDVRTMFRTSAVVTRGSTRQPTCASIVRATSRTRRYPSSISTSRDRRTRPNRQEQSDVTA